MITLLYTSGRVFFFVLRVLQTILALPKWYYEILNVKKRMLKAFREMDKPWKLHGGRSKL